MRRVEDHSAPLHLPQPGLVGGVRRMAAHILLFFRASVFIGQDQLFTLLFVAFRSRGLSGPRLRWVTRMRCRPSTSA